MSAAEILQARVLTPEVGDRESSFPFVGREMELGLVDQTLEAMIKGARGERYWPPYDLIEFYGMKGIGKSALLGEIGRHCQEKGVPSAYFELDSRRYPDGSVAQDVLQDPILLMAAVIKGGEEASRQEAKSFWEALDNYHDLRTKQPLTEDEKILLEERERRVKAEANDWARGLTGPVAFLLDSLDKLDPSVKDDFETTLLSPLVLNKNCCVIWTSDKPVRFKRFEIRRRRLADTNSRQLPPLSILETSVLAGTSLEVARQIDDLVHGYPLLTRKLIEQRLNFGMSIPSDLLTLIFDKVVNQEIMGEIKEKERNILMLLSVTRGFPISLLEKLMIKRLIPPAFLDAAANKEMAMTSRLAENTFVTWNDELKEQGVVEPLRSILDTYFCLTSPTVYEKVVGLAISSYIDLINLFGETIKQDLAEDKKPTVSLELFSAYLRELKRLYKCFPFGDDTSSLREKMEEVKEIEEWLRELSEV